MATEVSRTFDILERYLLEFPRKDALGGKTGRTGMFTVQLNMCRNRISLRWDSCHLA